MKTSRVAAVTASMLATAALWTMPPTANGQIFVANSLSSTIGEYTNSGGTVNTSLISGLNDPLGLTVSGTNLYVTNPGNGSVHGFGTIGEYNAVTGATINASLIAGLDSPWGIAVSGTNIFVTNFYAGTIGEYTTSGTVVNAQLVSGLDQPRGIAVSGSDIFVTNTNGWIGEYSAVTGATVNAHLISGLNNPYGIAVAGSNLFVTNGGTFSSGSYVPNSGAIGEYTTSGGVMNASLVSGLDDPTDIAVSDSDLFVTLVHSGGIVNDTIGEYTTSGDIVNSSLVSGLSAPFGIAVADVPEPASISLLALGVPMLIRRRRY